MGKQLEVILPDETLQRLQEPPFSEIWTPEMLRWLAETMSEESGEDVMSVTIVVDDGKQNQIES